LPPKIPGYSAYQYDQRVVKILDDPAVLIPITYDLATSINETLGQTFSVVRLRGELGIGIKTGIDKARWFSPICWNR